MNYLRCQSPWCRVGLRAIGVAPCGEASRTVQLLIATTEASRSVAQHEPPAGFTGSLQTHTGPKMTSTIAALTLIIAGMLIALAMIIRFLTYVYDRGGPKHVLGVARALREVYDPNWPSKLLGYLPLGGKDDGDSKQIP
jgi:hypothetical protein